MTYQDDNAASSLEDNAKSATRSLHSALDRVIDKAESAVNTLGSRASATAAKLGDDAKDNLQGASYKTQKMVDEIGPFLRDRPYLTLGVAALAGVVIGLVARGSKPAPDAQRKP